MRTTKIVKLTDENLEEINEFLLGNSTTECSYVGSSFTTPEGVYVVLIQEHVRSGSTLTDATPVRAIF